MKFPDFVYLILGATHPSLVRTEGERYRISLERMAKELGIQKHVIFYNRFVELDELTEFIGAADLYITPYLNAAQAVSGTLAYAFGCGQAVISTPYWHAEELLADDRGVLVPFADSAAIGREIIALLKDDPRRQAMRKRAYQLGREMTWSRVAEFYVKSFQDARRSRVHVPKPLAVRTLDEQPLDLPRMNLDHLLRMSDSTGILQHACYSIPNNHEGYCTDDNARALVLTVLLEELGKDSPELHQAASTYAAFLNYAFQPGERPISKLHELRSALDGRRWFRRFSRPRHLGTGHLRRPIAASKLSILGDAVVPKGVARMCEHDFTSYLGAVADWNSRIPPSPQRRSAGQPNARHADRTN